MTTYKANIPKIYAFKFFSSFGLMAGVLVPFFTEWGKISFTTLMLLQAWFMLWNFLLEVPTGVVADYFGRKHSLALAALVSAVAFSVYTITPNIYLFLFCEFLLAGSMALFSGAEDAFVYDTLKKTKESNQSKRIFGRADSYKLSGLMVAAPIGSVIASHWGLQMPMALQFFPMMIAFLIGLTLKEPRTDKKVESMRYLKILREGVGFFYRNRILKILALDFLVIDSIAFFVIWLYQPMLTQAGVSIIYFGIIHAVIVASEILVMNGYSWMEKWLGGKRRLIFASSIITGVAFIIGGLTKFIPLVIVVIILAGGFGLGRRPLFSSYLNKYIPSEKRATVLSSVSMLRKFTMVLMYPLVGLLVDQSLNYTLIILGIVAVIFSLVSRVREEHLVD
ncbi:MFS transporter [Patescibacteria group bacterium]|nr:MFS transporter [Patescibacteria group bacterium]